MSVRIGSLCSGYGGLDLAVEEVTGGRTVWVSDIDPGACKVLAHRFPDAPNLGDMTVVDWTAVEPVDVLCGGTPCQDLSHAGKRAGMTDGTRSNLWVAMREAIAVLRPSLVVWENVDGSASAHADSDLERDARLLAGVRRRPGQPVLRALGRVVGDLSSLGYVGSVGTVRASDVGAPHRRTRRFLAAWPADAAGDPWGFLHRDSRAAAHPPHLRHQRSGQARDRRAGPADGGLLPTPRARDPKGIDPNPRGGDLNHALSLLPTPRATDGTKGGPNQRGSSEDLMLPSAVHLISTRRKDGYGNTDQEGSGEVLPDVRRGVDAQEVQVGEARGSERLPATRALLPAMREQSSRGPARVTPMASAQDHRADCLLRVWWEGAAARPSRGPESGEQRPQQPQGHVPVVSPTAALAGGPGAACSCYTRWGSYEQAIRRWESVLGRQSPTPTSAGPSGRPRLDARFSEFLMGMPAGWVTDVPGVTRNEALRLCGNGVVTQQAVHALRVMLARASSEVAA